METLVEPIRHEIEGFRQMMRETCGSIESPREIALASQEASEGIRKKAESTEALVEPIRHEIEYFREKLNEMCESMESPREIALASQEVSEGAREKIELMEALLGRVAQVEPEDSALRCLALAHPLPPPTVPFGWDSVIVSELPEILAEFRGEQFSLLWRGGRDGFDSRDFHDRCDGHSNTLTVILDTNGNIFGGFTPVEWDSQMPTSRWDDNNCFKSDPSLKSFLFTLKNPHNVPARRFALKAEQQNQAIYCHSEYGPNFTDVGVSNKRSASTHKPSSRGGARCIESLGNSYTNDTELEGETFFTGSIRFEVQEIEVFEITS
jgi:hypothetical protein